LSEFPYVAKVFLALFSMAVLMFVSQKAYKKILTRPQYDYIRDVLLVIGFAISVLWFGGFLSRFVVGTAFLALVTGVVQQKFRHRDTRYLFLLVGLLYSLWGPGINFIGLSETRYLYLSQWSSFVITALWIAIFPALVQELDKIPGMSGHLLAVTFSLSIAVTFFSGQNLGEAFLVSLTALVLLAVFWSRHGHMYRQLGKPLAAFWGTILAGTSLLGVSKGITFSTLMILPLGLFAIPIVEHSLHLASVALMNRTAGPRYLYRGLIGRGIDHPSTIHLITLMCGTLGAVVSVFQLTDGLVTLMIVMLMLISVATFASPLIVKLHSRTLVARAPAIWGIHVDNVSMNYALSKVRMAIKRMEAPFLVVTLNAIAARLGRVDDLYRKAATSASLRLADGCGLVWGLKFLGTPVQERVTGIDFMEQICRNASVEGWPVYLLGSEEETVKRTATVLRERYQGLHICGYHSGYFSIDEEKDIISDIRNSGAKVLFVAMGVPKQEKWLYETLPLIGPVVAGGVGGAFDVISGKLARAPQAFQKCGLEWLYRLFQEPWRFKRDLQLFTFACLVLLTRIGIVDNRKEVTKE